MSRNTDYYARLNLPRDASAEEVRRSYREAARRLHPDKNVGAGDTELFLDIQEAYEVLSDPGKKAEYDQSQPPEPPPAVIVNKLFSRPYVPKLSEAQLFYVFLDLSANPEVAVDESPPLNVCLAIDNSTSMQGALMDTVKATAIELVRQMRPVDILSIVAFDDRAEVLLAAGSRLSQSDIETSIQMLHPKGATEIYRGLEAGYAQVRRYRDSKHVNHIILITDGHTYGDEAQCTQLAEQASVLGIGISCLGIGNEWNDKFLDNLATISGGNTAYVSKPAGISQFLKEKFSCLGASYAENITYDFELDLGVHLTYAFRIQPDAGPLGNESHLHLGNLPYNQSLNILLEFLIDALPADATQLDLAKGGISVSIPSLAAPVFTVRLNLSRPTRDDISSEPPPQAIVQAMSRLTLYRMQERARKDVAEGKVRDATRRLQSIATHLFAQGKRELASTILAEADYLVKNQAFSEAGEKRIKYGTRSLLLPSTTGGKTI